MKQLATWLLLCLYTGYFSAPVVNPFGADEWGSGTSICTNINHLPGAESCSGTESCTNEFSGLPLLSNHHQLAPASVRPPYNALVAVLPFSPALEQIATTNLAGISSPRPSCSGTMPLFLQNRVLRL